MVKMHQNPILSMLVWVSWFIHFCFQYKGLCCKDIKAWISGLYQKTICAYVTPDTPTPIEKDTYDVLLCSAGMFPGSIVPQVTFLIHVLDPCPLSLS